MRRRVVVAFSALALAVACSETDVRVPVRPAPPSRHAALVDALTDDARAFAFSEGDWLEDLGDAPFYGVAWLSRRTPPLAPDDLARRDAALARADVALRGDLVEGDLQDRVMAALGVIEHIGASGDRTLVPVLDAFIDRLDAFIRRLGDYLQIDAGQSLAFRSYGPTAMTALIARVEAQYALLVGGARADERTDRAVEIDAALGARAFADLVDADTGSLSRGYTSAPGDLALSDAPNLAMLILKARLFRLTKKEDYRLEARALYVTLRPLKLTDAPARYASPSARATLGLQTRALSTLSSQNDLALGLMLLFEITGELRFVEEADRVLDGIAAMRGPWCTTQVNPGSAERCTTGLLHHVVDGRLARPEDRALFCAGCNLQTLYVAGYRRALAGEPFGR